MPKTMEYTMMKKDQEDTAQNEDIQENIDEVENNEEEDNEAEEETLIVSIGEEDPDEEEEVPETAPDWVKDLRKTNREQKKKLKEFEARETEREAAKDKVEVGDEPSPDDYEYGQNEQYAKDLIAWNDRKRQLESKKKSEKDEVEAADQRYQDKLTTYNASKSALKVSDFDEVEEIVKEKFSVQQHAIAIHGLDKPELFMLAVGKNQKVLDRLSDIKDPVIFAIEIGKIEAKLKTSRKKAPAPETRLNGTAAMSGSADKHLDKLERESEKTGDRTKILAYKRQLKKAS